MAALPRLRAGNLRPGGDLYLLHPVSAMTLKEMSGNYREAAQLLRERLHLLRQMQAQATDAEEIWHIQRRIAELTPMLTQMNELAELTEHYYERGYYRNEKYTL